jgi:phosphoribosylformylglycinamidine synthase
LGANVTIPNLGSSSRLDALLFGESQGRVIIGVSPEKVDLILNAAQSEGVPAQVIGQSTEGPEFSLTVNDQEIVRSDISKLQKIWEDAIPSHMQAV